MFNAARSYGKMCGFAAVLCVLVWPLLGWYVLIPIAIVAYPLLQTANQLERRDTRDFKRREHAQRATH